MSSMPPITFNAIGYLKSCFVEKNGSPRQPSVCRQSRAQLAIESNFTNPHHSLMSLQQFSHVWLIFLFHMNENTHVRAKIKPPRLDGEKIGVFASRSPHRPNPIGLTLAKLDKVDGNIIHLSGIDIVDGTPILDIKPYIPDYDNPPADQDIQLASWLTLPPVKPLTVQFTSQAEDDLQQFFPSENNTSHSKYQLQLLKDSDEARSVIHDVVASDPRSTYRRNKCTDEVYHFTVDKLNISCKFENEVAIITQIVPVDDIQHLRDKFMKNAGSHQ
ncbi:uncharacterized protein TRIADDRAFT_60485 [Trichoplax adhaerens]|uniref:TsaA-like domain-containing protein n=1 Tax=Trichoplax adhaerens TaxID=10228 RepID=B3S8C2_TRIAD|nr:hypothetical protein TRIADDRAFT_60485 [Trichoplax adhaerens]EDV21173.1 hypothetical protein TRIADDRAFT_60485 [Trichoplax adhaerens]|eukprot:XP_002116503.1 hypothetical protein TRIADDRAFT_60485 [Trichoplax adhaerens]